MKIKLNYNVKSRKWNCFSTAELSKFRLANKLIKRGNIKAKDVNKLLDFSNIKIGKNQLDKFINKPRLNLSRDTMKTPEFFQSLGTYRSKIQVPGVYIWTHIPTGNKYVGSSSNLARRLQGYFHGTHKSVGKFIPLLKLEGLDQFKLEIIPITEHYFVNLELALEQYFLLHS